ncbi:porin family protein [Wenyingzhuangia sp. IMCC45574]
MKKFFCICCYLFFLSLAAQEKEEVFVDNKYLEDQFYIGIQYNSILSPNTTIDNNGIPYSLQAGFIKDIPINKRRNIGFGIGLGYSFDLIRPNITITTNNNELVYNISNSFDNYRYTSHSLELPLEFRWRTSTPTKFSFWRIYTGASIVYNFSNQASFEDNGTDTTYKNLDAWRKTNYTVYTSIGYGTWNFHIKYSLNAPFTDNTLTSDGKSLDFNQLKIGVMFYIL